jgi:uncharacterized protein (UPF0276 family)
MDVRTLAKHDLGVGIGLRSAHYPHILEKWPKLDWFEILSENYMHTGGRPVQILDRVAERYPIVMHGVSMNIGSTDPIDRDYLRELKKLFVRCKARFLSDHLCWTGVEGTNLHDLLPLPYTEEALRHLTKRVRQAQDLLELPLVLENASTYLEYTHSTIHEAEFLARLCAETGCGLLLDVNNVFVTCSNHGLDAHEYLAKVPWPSVVQFHLAGHTRYETHILDTHDHPVCDEVWELYGEAHRLSGGRSTLLEWDAKIPSFAEVRAEAHKAKAWRKAKPAVRARELTA